MVFVGLTFAFSFSKRLRGLSATRAGNSTLPVPAPNPVKPGCRLVGAPEKPQITLICPIYRGHGARQVVPAADAACQFASIRVIRGGLRFRSGLRLSPLAVFPDQLHQRVHGFGSGDVELHCGLADVEVDLARRASSAHHYEGWSGCRCTPSLTSVKRC